MTIYEMLSLLIGALALLAAIGGLVIALLNFFDKRNGTRKK